VIVTIQDCIAYIQWVLTVGEHVKVGRLQTVQFYINDTFSRSEFTVYNALKNPVLSGCWSIFYRRITDLLIISYLILVGKILIILDSLA